MYYYPKDRRASIEWRNSRIVFYFIMGALISTALVYAVVMTTFGYQSHAVVIFAYFLGTFFMTVSLLLRGSLPSLLRESSATLAPCLSFALLYI